MNGVENAMPSLNTYALCSVADVKANLDISSSTWDSVFTLLINACTDWIEKYCGGRRFLSPGTDVTEYFESPFRVGDPVERTNHWLSVKSWPIISVTSVSFRSGLTPPWTGNIQPAQNYDIYPDHGQLYLRIGYPRGPQSVQVIYQGGFATIPSDLQYACIKMVSKEFFRRKAEGKNMERSGGNQVMWNQGMEADLIDLLSAYRRIAL